MAGPATMALGGYAFESYGFSFKTRGSKISTNWAEIEVAGGMNPAQWTGGQSETITIRGVLFPAEFGGLDVLNALMEAARKGEVLPLVGLDNPQDNIRGMWRLESINDESDLFLDGQPLRDAYRITLKKMRDDGGVGFQPPSVLTLFG